MTDREKLQKALAPLHASDTAVQEVLEMAERKNTNTVKKSTRTLLIAAVVAVLLLGMALAVTASSWSAGLQNNLRLTDEEALALEETGLVTHPDISDTHDGVTVSIEQAMASGNTAWFALRVEGLDVPEGYTLVWDGPLAEIDGERASGWSAGVYRDLHWDWDRQQFVYSDGSPAPVTEEYYTVPREVREDGSVEMDISVTGGRELDSLLGKEITLTLYRLGTVPVSDEAKSPVYTAEGPWVLTWRAEGPDQSRTWVLDEPLGDGVTLKSVSLSALSARIEYEYPALSADNRGHDTEWGVLITTPTRSLYKIIMKDGTEYTDVLGMGTEGPEVESAEEFEEAFTYSAEMSLTHAIDPNEAAALVFREAGPGDAPDGGKAVYYTVTLPE